MATTNNRKRRKTKHRGNAAGMVEARGKTSATSRQAGAAAAKGRGGRRNRFDDPPTWRGAAVRAGVAALLFVLLVIFVFGQPAASSVPLGIAVFLMYVPLGYFTDLALYRRRQKKLGRA